MSKFLHVFFQTAIWQNWRHQNILRLPLNNYLFFIFVLTVLKLNISLKRDTKSIISHTIILFHIVHCGNNRHIRTFLYRMKLRIIWTNQKLSGETGQGRTVQVDNRIGFSFSPSDILVDRTGVTPIFPISQHTFVWLYF